MKENKGIHKGFILFLLVFAISVVFFMKEENQEKFVAVIHSFGSHEKELELSSTLECEGEEKFYYFNGTVIKWDGEVMTFLNPDGSQLLKKEFSFIRPGIIIQENHLFVIDRLMGDVYELDRKGNTVTKINLDESIFHLKEENGYILSHIKDEDENLEKLKVTNREGKEIFTKQLDNILTYSTDGKGEYIISCLKLAEGEIGSVLGFYTSSGEEKRSIEFKDEVILFSNKLNSKTIVLTDMAIRIIEDEETLWSENYHLMKDIFLGNDKIYLLHGDNLEIINLKGEAEKKIIFGIDYRSMENLGKYIMLYGNRDILILKDGEEILKFRTEKDISKVYGENNTLIIVYSDSLQVYHMINKE